MGPNPTSGTILIGRIWKPSYDQRRSRPPTPPPPTRACLHSHTVFEWDAFMCRPPPPTRACLHSHTVFEWDAFMCRPPPPPTRACLHSHTVFEWDAFMCRPPPRHAPVYIATLCLSGTPSCADPPPPTRACLHSHTVFQWDAFMCRFHAFLPWEIYPQKAPPHMHTRGGCRIFLKTLDPPFGSARAQPLTDPPSPPPAPSPPTGSPSQDLIP